jgi:flagellin
MGLRIGTNIASITAQRNLAKSDAEATHAIRALSSGSRIVSPGDDAAGYAIAETLRAQAESLREVKQNAENAKGLIQVAEGGLSEQNNILIRMRELGTQASSDTVSDDERGFIDTEFQQLSQEFDRIAKTTTYGSKKLLTGTDETYEFQLGVHNTPDDIVKYKMNSDTTASGVGIKGLSVDDKSDARESLETIDEAMQTVAKARAGFGAIQSRLEYAGNNTEIQRENVLEARSRIADADVGEEVAKLTQAQVKQNFGISVLAQANQMPERALKLL